MNILTYGCEAQEMTQKEKRRIAGVEIGALKRSCGISRGERESEMK